ncbi:hypothetical protein MIND_00999400 [Mycena indigotica]|uniref:Uncharacterized protein n=1 Tax=Mycena indigotica TaxID=2126181 RepID=A0A8H6S858_9AGAR|nr:uncharacterized protein MIND_00999400 [Mycena indigotica]KAF7294628.1 hypothetical protein MIND_00999400 [Mycena indigotica]
MQNNQLCVESLREYFARIHWTTPPSVMEPEDRGYDPNAPLPMENLSPELQAQKDRIIEALTPVTSVVGSSLESRRRIAIDGRGTRNAANDPYALFLLELSGISKAKKRRQPFQQFMKEQRPFLTPIIQREWLQAKQAPGFKKKCIDADFRASVVRRIFKTLPKEQQDDYQARAKAEADELKAQFDEMARAPPDTSPEARHNALRRAGGLHWPGTPRTVQRYSVQYFSFGRNLTAAGPHWAQWDPARFKKILEFFVEYLQTAYTAEQCASSALETSETNFPYDPQNPPPRAVGTAVPPAWMSTEIPLGPDPETETEDEDEAPKKKRKVAARQNAATTSRPDPAASAIPSTSHSVFSVNPQPPPSPKLSYNFDGMYSFDDDHSERAVDQSESRKDGDEAPKKKRKVAARQNAATTSRPNPAASAIPSTSHSAFSVNPQPPPSPKLPYNFDGMYSFNDAHSEMAVDQSESRKIPFSSSSVSSAPFSTTMTGNVERPFAISPHPTVSAPQMMPSPSQASVSSSSTTLFPGPALVFRPSPSLPSSTSSTSPFSLATSATEHSIFPSPSAPSSSTTPFPFSFANSATELSVFPQLSSASSSTTPFSLAISATEPSIPPRPPSPSSQLLSTSTSATEHSIFPGPSAPSSSTTPFPFLVCEFRN